jgi:lysophospholipase L1-like esterase
MGTTSRVSLGDLYIPINNDLKAHYNEHYMDVIDIINKYGYSPDGTHLSQESYDAIAAAVYEKLKSLDYI